MFLLKIIHHLIRIAEKPACFIAPRTRLAEWFFWFEDDVKALRRVTDNLALTGICLTQKHAPGAAPLAEFTLFHAAYAYGERQYYGLSERWPAFLLRRITDAGIKADPALWLAGYESGYSDTGARDAGCDLAISATEQM
ncbi:hypothetical protein EHW66_19190 [Erwinia psidii]|uniref:hypothetical protein n=1 Tax=Erwinia psidii TaxID=69224 RepID=UPI00226B260C|nr:hypothetical protein [Erwinia psidii]MCX8967023.1 hypothetical protein [Erwinia psidii]